MKKKMLNIVYVISMILLLPLVFDLFCNKQFGSGFIILFLIAFGTWGIIKMRKDFEE